MITGNKGEWSELYVFLKLLGEGKLYAADENLEKIKNIFYPILKIIRKEEKTILEFRRQNKINIVNASTEETILSLSPGEFLNRSKMILSKIKEGRGSSFSIPEIESFLSKIKCKKITRSSSSKGDINIVIHDLLTNTEPKLEFSIKSKLGSPSTLLNAGKSTNFIYCVNYVDYSAEEIEKINSFHKIGDRVKEIEKKGGELEFQKTERKIFEYNLKMIDTELPKILSELLKLYYKRSSSTIVDLTNILKRLNPCDFDFQYGHPFYSNKIKRFLRIIALGMMPGTPWDGRYQAIGGYIIVKEDGEVLCYHICNTNLLDEYLFRNTKLETADTNRHKFGSLIYENKSYSFKLNLQIRFL